MSLRTRAGVLVAACAVLGASDAAWAGILSSAGHDLGSGVAAGAVEKLEPALARTIADVDNRLTAQETHVGTVVGGLIGQTSTELGARLGQVDGLGLLPVRVTFGPRKQLGRPAGFALGAPVTGYEIHHGIAEVTDPAAEPFLDGCRRGAVWGTSWHGALENDDFRRAFLTEVAALANRDFAPAPDTDFAAVRQARLDALGDLVAGHLDLAALSGLIENGPPKSLPGLVASLDHDR